MLKNTFYAPEWLMYPNIPKGSIGWRMGYGESYLMDKYLWYRNLNDNDKKEYDNNFPKPIVWQQIEENIYRKDMYWTLKWSKDGQPKYNIDNLRRDFESGRKLNYIYFWGHHTKDRYVTKACFSQWYPSRFSVGVNKYLFMEQYMMAEKARLFGDKEIEQEIMKSTNPKIIKSLGRKIRNFDEETWNEIKYSIVLNGNYYKFMQNKKLLKFLLSTKDSILAEASPYDSIWGIQMSENDENIDNPIMWRGENLLGFALMEVRSEILRINKNSQLIDFERLYKEYGCYFD